MSWFPIVGIACLTAFLSARFRRRAEETLPVSLCLWMLILYGLAMLGRLSLIDAVSVVIVVAVGLWAVCKHPHRAEMGRFLRAYLFTPGMMSLLLGVLFLWFFTRFRYMSHGDELNYWAIEPKSLFYCNGLVDATHHSTIWFSAYMPGMQLLEWQGMHIVGEWRENLLHFCLFSCNLCFLLPLIRDSKWKKWYQIPMFAAVGILMPTIWSSFSYSYLGVDFTMGALLGFALVQVFRARSGDSFAPLALGAALCALVLTKSVGVAWAGVVMAFWWVVRDPQASKRPWILAAVSALACFFSWKIFCQANGLVNYLSDGTKTLLSSILSGTYQRPSGTGHTTLYSLKAFALFPTNWDQTHKALLGLPFAIWTLIFAAIPYSRRDSLAKRGKHTARRMIALILCLSLFSLALYIASYFVTFADEMFRYSGNYENVAIQLERYCLPFIVGFGCLSLELVHTLPRRSAKQKKPITLAKRVAVVLAALLMVNWQMIGFYLQPTPERVDWIEYEREHTDWFQQMSEEERKEMRILFAYSKIINYTAYALVPVTFTGLTAEALERTDNEECVREWVDDQRATHVIFYDDQNDSYSYLCEAFGIERPELNRLYRIDKSVQPYRIVLETGTEYEPTIAKNHPRKETTP